MKLHLDMRREFDVTSGHKASLTISCRPREEADLAALIALWVTSWQKTMPRIDFEIRRGWFQRHLQALEAAGFITICAFDSSGIMLGFVTINPLTHELDQLAVAASLWGRGVATRLLSEARHLSPGMLLLDVNFDNPRAVHFYEREGFRCIGDGVNPASGLKTRRMRWMLSGKS